MQKPRLNQPYSLQPTAQQAATRAIRQTVQPVAQQTADQTVQDIIAEAVQSGVKQIQPSDRRIESSHRKVGALNSLMYRIKRKGKMKRSGE